MALEPNTLFKNYLFLCCFSLIALKELYKATRLWAEKKFIEHVDKKSIKNKGYQDLFSSKIQQKENPR